MRRIKGVSLWIHEKDRVEYIRAHCKLSSVMSLVERFITCSSRHKGRKDALTKLIACKVPRIIEEYSLVSRMALCYYASS